MEKVVSSPSFHALGAILSEQQSNVGSSSGVGAPVMKNNTMKVWACRHCTFVNEATDICEMCGLPSD